MTDFPEERQGFTDMTFCLLRFELANILRRIVYIPPGPNKCTEFFAGLTIRQKEKWINDCHQAMENKYLKNCDMNIPICWVTATISRLIMSKMWLVVYHPYQRKDGGTTLPQETKDKLFITSLENVEYSLLLETEARTMKWGWLFRSYVQWHAIAFLLSELCVRTKGEAVERAWRALEATAGRWWFPLNDSSTAGKGQQGCLWKPLRKLLEKAKAARERELALERASIAIRNAPFRNSQCSFEFQEVMTPNSLSSVASDHLGVVPLDSMLRPTAPKLGEMPLTGHPSWPNSPTQSRPRDASSPPNSNGMSKQQKLPNGAPSEFSNDSYILHNNPVRHFGDLLDFGLDQVLNEVMGSGARTCPDPELGYADTKTAPAANMKTPNYMQSSPPVSSTIPAQPFATSVAQTVANGYPTFGDGILPSTGMDFKISQDTNNELDVTGDTDDQQAREAGMMDNGDMDWTLWDDMVNQYGTMGHPTNPTSSAGAGTLGIVHWF